MKFLKLAIIGVALLLGACNAQRNVLYLQNLSSGMEVEIPESYQMRIKPMDKLTVVVSCPTPELAVPFNTSSSYTSLTGGTLGSSSANQSSLRAITVNNDGTITLPILGEVPCAGLTREELANTIEEKILKGGYLENPSVNVEFADATISILGEVNKPGRYDIEKDRITIFEALAMAGDMTIYGKRDDVAIIREMDGKNIVIKLDLRNSDVLAMPDFYLQQNDIVIVSPNKYRAATSEINQNRSFWVSIVSTAISLATLLFTIFRLR